MITFANKTNNSMKQLLTSLLERLWARPKDDLLPAIACDADEEEDLTLAGVTVPLERVLNREDLPAEARRDIKRALHNVRCLYTKKIDREKQQPPKLDIKPSEVTVSSIDEELVSHVIEHIEAHMQDANYTVVQLSSAVGMTRGHLYKKMMAITGKSPLEIIRIIKMSRGKSLLEQGRTNISEVSGMVGLSSKQFASYFKETYNTTPSEFLRSINKPPCPSQRLTF